MLCLSPVYLMYHTTVSVFLHHIPVPTHGPWLFSSQFGRHLLLLVLQSYKGRFWECFKRAHIKEWNIPHHAPRKHCCKAALSQPVGHDPLEGSNDLCTGVT